MTKIEFDNLMSTATQTTIVELPGTIIDWELVIDKPCTIVGNNTIVNLVGKNIPYAVTITDSCDLSGISIISDKSGMHVTNEASFSNITVNCEETGIYLTGDGTGGLIEDVIIDGADNGLVFHDARKYTLNAPIVKNCQIGVEFEGTSDVIGDTESDPSWSSGLPPVPEADRTNRTHSISINGLVSYGNKFGIRILNSNALLLESVKIFDNSESGVWQMPNSYNNKINGEIYKNIGYGIKNTDRQGNLHDVDARQTWWGDITGPSGYGKGSGQKISTNVSTDPWLRDGTDPDVLLYPQTRKWIWGMLGYPIIRVELSEEMVTECINMAIDKFMYYQTPEPDWAYATLGTMTYELDLADLKTREGYPVSITKHQVIEVAYQPYNDLFAQLTGSGMDFFLTYYMQGSGGSFLSDFYMALGYKDDMERTLGINPSYEFLSHLQPNGMVKDVVRLYPRPQNAVKIGIKYNRTLTQEEVDSHTWIRKYALAWAKEQLGEIRSKFSSLPSPTGETTLNGSSLKAEAATEKEALITELIGLTEPLSFSIG
jgi:hypothetical protein